SHCLSRVSGYDPILDVTANRSELALPNLSAHAAEQAAVLTDHEPTYGHHILPMTYSPSGCLCVLPMPPMPARASTKL
ncbi:hypothetical protein Tco_0024187, partial [Tanacetum coccineum]